MSLEEAIASTQLETRQYAKRQWTWFRRDAQVQWLHGFGEDAAMRRHPSVRRYSPSGWRLTKPWFSGRSGRQRGPSRLEGSSAGLVSRRRPAIVM